ncbi:alpha/beta hydrolase [Algoriphagus machipongonensis]|uniref:Esterase n=1 Tax=Algoriphagus machipongonensis TaxID=388413 RepID=A3HTN2_9BACT|nr:alpha/beta hydrolase family protein [Algoriphagus machipongonensis]EAZ83200.1 esterase [Algoriphagus machipongonensis]
MKKLSAVFLVSILAFQLYAQAQSAGKIEFSSMPSEILGVDREFAVYLPKSYQNNPDKKYPVLYLLHGGGDTHTAWPEKGGLEAAANQIIDSKESAEMIIVCPEAGKIHMNYFNDSEWRYEDYFFEELIPYIESNYRAIPDKNHRAVAGLSMGGGGTLVYAQHHPEMFAAAFAMSGYLYRMNLSFLDPNDPETEKRQQIVERNNAVKLLQGASEEKVKQLKTVDWFIDCGDDDFTFTPNMEFIAALKEQGIPYQLRVRDGGHTWEYWHSSLYIALPHISDVFRELTQK